jgi:acid stress chaperone HdeB
MTITATEDVMRTIAVVVLGLTFASASPARAQVTLDISKITCWQFATYKVTSPQNIAIWVSGYYHGTRGDAIIDTQDLQAKTTKMQDYCIKNPDVPFMQAVETILGEKN